MMEIVCPNHAIWLILARIKSFLTTESLYQNPTGWGNAGLNHLVKQKNSDLSETPLTLRLVER